MTLVQVKNFQGFLFFQSEARAFICPPQPIQSSRNCTAYVIFFSEHASKSFSHLTGTRSTHRLRDVEHLFSFTCSCNLITSEQSSGREKKKKKEEEKLAGASLLTLAVIVLLPDLRAPHTTTHLHRHLAPPPCIPDVQQNTLRVRLRTHHLSTAVFLGGQIKKPKD